MGLNFRIIEICLWFIILSDNLYNFLKFQLIMLMNTNFIKGSKFTVSHKTHFWSYNSNLNQNSLEATNLVNSKFSS